MSFDFVFQTRHISEGSSDPFDSSLLDDPWRPAEAYNLMIVAQTFYVQSDFPRALRAAGTLCGYLDVLDPVQIFSVIGKGLN